VLERWQGGKNGLDNLRLAHKRCNSDRSNRPHLVPEHVRPIRPLSRSASKKLKKRKAMSVLDFIRWQDANGV
jgi:hypothetical protein